MSPGAGSYLGWVIVELAPDAIFVVDRTGRFVLANRRAEEMFGYDRETLLHSSVEALMPARFETEHRVHRNVYEASPTTRPMGRALDLRGRRADGTEFPVEISLSPVTVRDGLHVVAIVRDVTERSTAGTGHGQGAETHRRADLELHQVIIEHLTAAGVDLAWVGRRVGRDLAERLNRAVEDLDAVIRAIEAATAATDPPAPATDDRERGSPPSGGLGPD